MDFGLKNSVINSISTVFAGFPEIEKAVIYGSRAKGNYKQGSDIDISLFGTLLNSNIINKLNLELDDLMLPYTFDISIYEKISNPQLKEHIDRVGKLFYQK
jgi:uncharacterized protein